MRRISAFASRHLIIARFLITLSHIALLGLAMKLAGLIDNINLFLSPKILVASLVLFFITTSVFQKPKSYYGKRLRYFICGATLFVALCCFFSNNTNTRYNTYTQVGGAFVDPVEKTLSKSQQRKQLIHFLKQVHKEAKASKGDFGKTLAITGVVFGALFLLSLVAILSCSVACNGSGALAVLLALAGTFGVVWLARWAIIKISKKKPVPDVKEAG